jgi:SAM-dependent methyltransferase
MATTFEEMFFTGAAVYGDDFDADRIAEWYGVEKRGLHDVFTRPGPARASRDYEYHALNRHCAYRFLDGMRFRQCLAFGCGDGEDVAPLARQVDRFLAIEPVQRCWKDDIGGTPAIFRMPTLGGRIDCEDGANDLTVCLHTLHHIPNVTGLLTEFARVTARGGLFILREPISTMGDWRRPRPGLTANERGFPVAWLEQRFDALGFRVRHKTYCSVPLTDSLTRILRTKSPYNIPILVRADRIACTLTQKNITYHRNSWRKKLAPRAVYYVLQRL